MLRVDPVAGAGERATRGARRQPVEQRHQHLDAPAAVRARELEHQRRDGEPDLVRKLHAARRFVDQVEHRLQLGERGHHLLGRVARELQHDVARRHALAGAELADPVVRQVRPGDDEVAGREIADMVADEELAARTLNQVDFVLRMKMPFRDRVRIVVRPCAKRFVAAGGDDLEVWVHLSLLRVHGRAPAVHGRDIVNRCGAPGEGRIAAPGRSASAGAPASGSITLRPVAASNRCRSRSSNVNVTTAPSAGRPMRARAPRTARRCSRT